MQGRSRPGAHRVDAVGFPAVEISLSNPYSPRGVRKTGNGEMTGTAWSRIRNFFFLE